MVTAAGAGRSTISSRPAPARSPAGSVADTASVPAAGSRRRRRAPVVPPASASESAGPADQLAPPSAEKRALGDEAVTRTTTDAASSRLP